ncbi:MAG: phage baseplate protein [Cyanobacteria bacterium P01_F01_bin.56]
MRALSVPDLLAVWERGLAQSPTERALLMLATACPDLSVQELAKLSIGQRDDRLLTLREWAFGSQLVSIVDCPNCGDRLELDFTIADIRVPSSPDVATEHSLEVEGYRVKFRLPNSEDLTAIATQDPQTAPQLLLKRCLLETTAQKSTPPFDQLPETVLNDVVAQMALADPQAEIKLAVTCPGCGHAWKSVFDIVAYFWEELNVWALRLLREVHILASAYGWREADILAMHPYRRQLYLEMVGR